MFDELGWYGKADKGDLTVGSNPDGWSRCVWGAEVSSARMMS